MTDDGGLKTHITVGSRICLCFGTITSFQYERYTIKSIPQICLQDGINYITIAYDRYIELINAGFQPACKQGTALCIIIIQDTQISMVTRTTVIYR